MFPGLRRLHSVAAHRVLRPPSETDATRPGQREAVRVTLGHRIRVSQVMSPKVVHAVVTVTVRGAQRGNAFWVTATIV